MTNDERRKRLVEIRERAKARDERSGKPTIGDQLLHAYGGPPPGTLTQNEKDIRDLLAMHAELAEKLYVFAPWGQFPDDDVDPNFGRQCLCGAPLRAGSRADHKCDLADVERVRDAARYRGGWWKDPSMVMKEAASVLRRRAELNRAAGPAWHAYALAQRNAADWLDHIANENSCKQCHGFGRPDHADNPQCSSCGSLPPETLRP